MSEEETGKMPDEETGKKERRPFLVFELHREEGPPARSRELPVKYSMSEVGCYFARNGDQACKDAALAEDRLGYFVAVEATFPKLVFDTRDYSRDELKSFVKRAPTAASDA